MSQQSTSCWIRRCNRHISSSSSLLSSAADEREMKNSSLRLVSKLHLRSPRSQSPHCFSSGRPRAAGGRWSHQFSREKGQTTVELTQRKRLTMNALHSLENRARALCPTHKSCVIWGQKRWYGSAHLLKRFIILTLQKQSPLKTKKRMSCFTGTLLCPQILICLRHRLPPANVKCIVCFYSCFRDAEGIPIAPSRGRSVEFPSEGNLNCSIACILTTCKLNCKTIRYILRYYTNHNIMTFVKMLWINAYCENAMQIILTWLSSTEQLYWSCKVLQYIHMHNFGVTFELPVFGHKPTDNSGIMMKCHVLFLRSTVNKLFTEQSAKWKGQNYTMWRKQPVSCFFHPSPPFYA